MKAFEPTLLNGERMSRELYHRIQENMREIEHIREAHRNPNLHSDAYEIYEKYKKQIEHYFDYPSAYY